MFKKIKLYNILKNRKRLYGTVHNKFNLIVNAVIKKRTYHKSNLSLGGGNLKLGSKVTQSLITGNARYNGGGEDPQKPNHKNLVKEHYLQDVEVNSTNYYLLEYFYKCLSSKGLNLSFDLQKINLSKKWINNNILLKEKDLTNKFDNFSFTNKFTPTSCCNYNNALVRQDKKILAAVKDLNNIFCNNEFLKNLSFLEKKKLIYFFLNYFNHSTVSFEIKNENTGELFLLALTKTSDKTNLGFIQQRMYNLKKKVDLQVKDLDFLPEDLKEKLNKNGINCLNDYNLDTVYFYTEVNNLTLVNIPNNIEFNNVVTIPILFNLKLIPYYEIVDVLFTNKSIIVKNKMALYKEDLINNSDETIINILEKIARNSKKPLGADFDLLSYIIILYPNIFKDLSNLKVVDFLKIYNKFNSEIFTNFVESDQLIIELLNSEQQFIFNNKYNDYCKNNKSDYDYENDLANPENIKSDIIKNFTEILESIELKNKID